MGSKCGVGSEDGFKTAHSTTTTTKKKHQVCNAKVFLGTHYISTLNIDSKLVPNLQSINCTCWNCPFLFSKSIN